MLLSEKLIKNYTEIELIIEEDLKESLANDGYNLARKLGAALQSLFTICMNVNKTLLFIDDLMKNSNDHELIHTLERIKSKLL